MNKEDEFYKWLETCPVPNVIADEHNDIVKIDFDVSEDGNSPQLTETYEFGQTVSNEDWGRGVGTSRVKKEDLEWKWAKRK